MSRTRPADRGSPGTKIRRLVPFLQADRYDMLICSTTHEPNSVLAIGPLDAAADSEFRQRVVEYLDKQALTARS